MDEPSHETALQAEVEIHDKAIKVTGRELPIGKGRAGELDALAARGGIDLVFDESAERDPLLPSSGGGEEDGNGDGEEEEPFAGLPWHKRPSIYWLIVPYALITLAFGGVIAPRINLVHDLVCHEYLNERQPAFAQPLSPLKDQDPCRNDEVERRATLFLLYCNLIAGILSAITAPKLGALSDRYGRTKLIAFTSVGSLLADLMTILAASRPDVFSAKWILVGAAMDGICGSFTTAFAIVHAYVADCVPARNLNVAYGYFHGVLFTGVAIGPLLTGVITKATKTPVTSFYIMLGVYTCFIPFVSLVVPESLTRQRQERAREKHRALKAERTTDLIESLREVNILEPLRILYPIGRNVNKAIRSNMLVLASVDTIMFGVAMGSVNIVTLYVNNRFNWGTFEDGIMMSITNTCRVLCLVLLLPFLNRRYRPKVSVQRPVAADKFDVAIIRIAVLFDTLGFLGLTLANTPQLVVASTVVAAFGGMASPTISSSLTKHVAPEHTGQLLGAMGLLHALARVVAPTVFSGIYYATVSTFRQAVFVCLTGTFAVAFLVSFFIKAGVSRFDVPSQQDDEETPILQRSD